MNIYFKAEAFQGKSASRWHRMLPSILFVKVEAHGNFLDF